MKAWPGDLLVGMLGDLQAMLSYLHREQMIEMNIAIDKTNENSEDSNESEIVRQIIVERNDEVNHIKCKECTKESECIDCIMKKALSDDFLKCDDCTTENACAECKVMNDEYLEESIESIMAKAKAFEDEVNNTADLLVDEDCAGTLHFNGAQHLDNLVNLQSSGLFSLALT